ncbi:hypothetical protein [Niallia taxi]|uniref:hypothetical protein n=1 Tax=Niallia taxi TaxID=2499688 RepID=UPI0013E3FC08|nr:hypothetical protein [Niallia taxi]
MNKILSTLKHILTNNSTKHRVDNYSPQTHKKCESCDGTGFEDVFFDCESCEGSGIVKKSYEEYVNSLEMKYSDTKSSA